MKAMLLKTGFDEGLVIPPQLWSAVGALLECQHVRRTGWKHDDPWVPSVPVLQLVEFIDWPQPEAVSLVEDPGLSETLAEALRSEPIRPRDIRPIRAGSEDARAAVPPAPRPSPDDSDDVAF